MLEETTGQPFSGVKILDLSWVGVGPIVARHLADFGATVIRVESSTRPDTLRMAPPFRDGEPGLDRRAFGAQFNSNKYGLALNLRKPEARELVKRLAAWADIVTDSMTPGSLARMGLGYDDLRAVNPDLIMYSTTQQGQTGPYRSFGGYGSHGAAAAGIYALTSWPDRGPAGPFGAYTDFVAPWFLITALIAALDHRDRTGEGQYLDQSQVEAALQILGPQLVEYTANGHARSGSANDDPEMFPHDAYPCRGVAPTPSPSPASAGEGRLQPDQNDSSPLSRHAEEGSGVGAADRWVAIAVRDDADFAALAEVIERPEWASDPAMRGAECRRAHGAAIDAAIAGWTCRHTPHEAMAALQAAGVPAGAVQSCEELFSDPQLAHRGHWWQLEHPVIGTHAYDAPAWVLSHTPSQAMRAGPTLGQHSADVCREILGLDEDAIAHLLIEGVLE